MRRLLLVLATMLFVVLPNVFSHAATSEPQITSILLDRTNILIKVSVPEGLRRVTLEGRSRLGESTWAPRALKRFEAPTTNTTEITFLLPKSESLEILRVRADHTELLPSTFFRGTNEFAGPQSSFEGTRNNVIDTDGGITAGPGNPPPATQTEVVESDIWKVAGNTLYFFNNLRGLQVIDISNPEAPALRGTYPLAASGEQMYVLPSGHAVLLTYSWCNRGGISDASKIITIDTAGASLNLASELTISGHILESRMIGSDLYVVSQTYQRTTNSNTVTWEGGTLVTTVSLANPSSPVRRSEIFIPAYAGTAAATPDYLFVVTYSANNYYTSELTVIDINTTDGLPKVVGKLNAAGRIADKFKINQDGNTLTAISHRSGMGGGFITVLENFSLASTNLPKLAELKLAEGEQLFATRFGGKRAYIVTYRRIDPLWIIDLTDATAPKIIGELHVPGWSTYLQPMGDRVLALGIDDTNSWRVALSLFDVSNPARPTLLSKAIMGQNNSWSEANSDEKALTVLPQHNLVLVPWHTYSTNGQSSSVQLVDLKDDRLTLRGAIDQANPRRATLHQDHIISISGRDLLSYTAANRDQPAFKSRLNLSWPVDKVLLAGDYLLEFQFGNQYWGAPNASATIRVAPASAPDRILSTITLTNGLPISGIDLRDNKLHVAQSKNNFNYWFWLMPVALDASQPTNQANFVYSIWDLSAIPELRQLATTNLKLTNDPGSSFRAIWPKTDLIVWSTDGGWGGYPYWNFARVGLVSDALWWGPWYSSTGGRLIAFDVSSSTNPVLKSDLNLNEKSDLFSFSKTFPHEGRLYLSHQKQSQVTIPIEPRSVSLQGTNITITELHTWITRYYLDVIDYADPAHPVVRAPVNIPGQLEGLSHDAAILYTRGHHYQTNGFTDYSEWLDASAYDGVSAFLVDSLKLHDWSRAFAISGADIFLCETNQLHRYKLSDSGKFAKLASMDLKTQINKIHFYGDLGVILSGNDAFLYDATDRSNFKLLTADTIGCLIYPSLDTADGALGRGLWLAEGDYGARAITIAPAGQ